MQHLHISLLEKEEYDQISPGGKQTVCLRFEMLHFQHTTNYKNIYHCFGLL